MRGRRRSGIVAAAAAGVLLGACTSGQANTPEAGEVEDEASPPADGGTSGAGEPDQQDPTGDEDAAPATFGPLGEVAAEITTEEGTLLLGEADPSGSLPDSLPVPADFDVGLVSGSGQAVGVSGRSAVPFAELVDLYADGLTAAGYRVEVQKEVADVVAVFGFDGPDGRGQVAISAAPGGAGTDVMITYDP